MVDGDKLNAELDVALAQIPAGSFLCLHFLLAYVWVFSPALPLPPHSPKLCFSGDEVSILSVCKCECFTDGVKPASLGSSRYLLYAGSRPAPGAAAAPPSKRSTAPSDTSLLFQKPFPKTRKGSTLGEAPLPMSFLKKKQQQHLTAL